MTRARDAGGSPMSAFRHDPVADFSRDPVRWWARLDAARIALVQAETGETTSYGALDALADAWAARLGALGVQPGDRVGLLARNRVAHVALLVGCTRLGATFVPLNWRLSPPELTRVLANAGPRVLFADAEFGAVADEAARSAEPAAGDPRVAVHALPMEAAAVDTLVAQRAAAVTHAPAHVAPPQREPPTGTSDDATREAPAMLLYTSGSTGEARGVVVPHRQPWYNALATITGWQLSSRDVGTALTPLFHTAAWGVFTWPLLVAGGRTVLWSHADADTLLDDFARFGVTVAFVVPTQLARLARTPAFGRPLPALRWLLSGGAPCPQRLLDAARAAGLRVRDAWGLTECGPNCLAVAGADSDHDGAPAGVGARGVLLPFLEGRITTADGRDAAPGDVGEVWLRGPQQCDGYFRDPARTAALFDDAGWLRTGDLAVREADGRLRIVGRARDVFISGGENVHPGEVEAALLADARIAEAVVVAVPDPDWGETPAAAILPVALPPAGERAAWLDDVRRLLRTRLAGYKCPRHLRVVHALPRLGSGKVDRRAVQALFASGAGPDAARPTGGAAPPA